MLLSTCKILLRTRPYHIPSSRYLLTVQSNESRIARLLPKFFCSEISPKDIAKAAVKKERTKTPELPKVTLLDEKDFIISVMTIPEAEKFATGKNLKLVKITDKDFRTARPVYKLMSDAKYLEEELNLRKEKKKVEKKKEGSYLKGEKLLVTTSKITDHDLEMKFKKLEKWLEKKYEVRVLISAHKESQSGQDEICKKIEKRVTNKGRIAQKQFKAGNLKLHILPLRDEPKSKESDDVNSNDESDVGKSTV